MKISALYSHLNGHEFLLVHQPDLWKEIETVIASVDAGSCKKKISKESRTLGKLLYSPVEMNKAFESEFKKMHWLEQKEIYWFTSDVKLMRKTLHLPEHEQKTEIEKAGMLPIASYKQTDFAKNRVAVEIQFGKYAFVAYDLFVKHLALYAKDQIDVGVEILPMKVLQSQMSTGPGYYEGTLYNMVRQGRGVPAVPLVLIGIEP